MWEGGGVGGSFRWPADEDEERKRKREKEREMGDSERLRQRKEAQDGREGG